MAPPVSDKGGPETAVIHPKPTPGSSWRTMDARRDPAKQPTDGLAEASDPAPSAGAPARVKVLFPLPLGKPYDYLATADLAPGTFVAARLGPRIVTGVVWPADGEEDAVDPAKLKPVETVFDAPPLAPDVIDFIAWTAAYTTFPAGAVLRLLMRAGDALAPPAGEARYRATGAAPVRPTPQRER